MVTLENEYYLRTILLLCEGGAYITKQILERELPNYGGDLDALLKQYKNKLRHEFHKKQMKKLFPNNGYDKTEINKWDIQMLIGVMLLLFRISLSDEEKQKLKDIKFIRHEVLAHSPSASLCLEKYADVQKDLRDAINTLANGFDQTVKDRCDEYIKTYASDHLDVKSAIKSLQEAKDTDDLFQEVINVIKNTEETLSKEISKAESNITQVFKSTEQKLSKNVMSVEHNISQEIKDSTKAISKGLRDIESDVKDSKQKISTEITVVKGSVRFTKETLAKEIDEIRSTECNTFKALMDVSDQIKNLQAWLMQNMNQGSHDRSATDLQLVSEDLRMKSKEVEKRMLTYDSDSSQSFANGTVTRENQSLSLHKSKYRLVAAIDFGTTYSGCAYSFRYEYQKNPHEITIRRWTGTNMYSGKVPTAVLFDSKKQFHSFGYDAEDKYCNLAEDDGRRDWYFFSRFKMKLYTEKVDRNIKLQEYNGKHMTAKDVFGAAIKYLKDEIKNQVKERGLEDLPDNEIHWILTVPAIWTDQAKQFMREAANTAGIDGEHLTIALEPEAASIYCQTKPVDSHKQVDHSFAAIHSGTKYMLIDLGGGTADITVHEKQTDGGLKELYKATGGAWGGTKVDEEFKQLIISIVGEEVFKEFHDEHMEYYLEFLRNFETKKKQNSKDGYIFIRIPPVLLETCKKDFTIAIRESDYDGKIFLRKDRLEISIEVWNCLFKPCCESIVRHISDLLKYDTVKGTNVFLMVGGFSECKLIQKAIKNAFPSVKVIIPEDTELAVLKGAVIFGHRPMAITSRISRYTYGISISPLFDRSMHPEFRRVVINGKDRCRDVFKTYIYAGENVRVGDARSGEHATLWPRQKEMKLKMYVSTRRNPKYVDEEDTKCIGNVVVHLPESDKLSVVNVKMMFGETELMVEATELSGNKSVLAYFDFL